MPVVYLALGSNVGDSRQFIADAIEQLKEEIAGLKQAPLYVSRAVGYTDQADFFNTAIQGETTLEPLELLRFVKGVEEEVGRRQRFRWGPREIDVDIIFYGDTRMANEVLTIPHPRFAEREFVLRPIADLDAGFIDPVSGLTVRRLLDKLPAADLSVLHKA